MNSDRRQKTKHLCMLSIPAAIEKLCQVGTWPRPPAAKLLRPGHDFYRGDLEGVQEVKDFIEYLASDQHLSAIYFDDPANPSLYILYEYWERLLLEIVHETQDIYPSKLTFRRWYSRFLREIYSETAKWRVVEIFSGLKLTSPKLVLDKSTVLTSLGAVHWWRTILEDYYYDVSDNWQGFQSDEASVVTTTYISKRAYRSTISPWPHLSNFINRHNSLLDAIRFTKSGCPRIHCSTHFQLSNFPVSDPFAYEYHDRERLISEEYTILNPTDFRTIKMVWRDRMNTSESNYLPIRMQTAYYRFFSSYDYKNLLESILDLTIALESLFSPVDSQELSYRIALRSAWLLSTEKLEHNATILGNKIYKQVRTMYDIRSAMVHGRELKPSDIHKWIEILSGIKYDKSQEWKLLELAREEARSIVRKAINACYLLSKLQDDGPKWPLPPDFDENIVTTGQRRLWQKCAGVRS